MKTLLPAFLVTGALAMSPVVLHADMVPPFGAAATETLYAAHSLRVDGDLDSDNGAQPDVADKAGAAGALLTGAAAGGSTDGSPRYAMQSASEQMDGNFDAGAVGQTGEAEDMEFVGSLPTDVDSVTERDSPVTEPATLSLLGTGIVSAASLLRRRLGRAKLLVA